MSKDDYSVRDRRGEELSWIFRGSRRDFPAGGGDWNALAAEALAALDEELGGFESLEACFWWSASQEEWGLAGRARLVAALRVLRLPKRKARRPSSLRALAIVAVVAGARDDEITEEFPVAETRRHFLARPGVRGALGGIVRDRRLSQTLREAAEELLAAGAPEPAKLRALLARVVGQGRKKLWEAEAVRILADPIPGEEPRSLRELARMVGAPLASLARSSIVRRAWAAFLERGEAGKHRRPRRSS